MHVMRVNYRALVRNSALDCYPDIPGPVGHGWALDDPGNLTYDWTNGKLGLKKSLTKYSLRNTSKDRQ